MSFETDKEELIKLLNLLQQKEIEFLAYRALLGALNGAHPEEHLAQTFQNLSAQMGTPTRRKFAALLQEVRESKDAADLLSLVAEWVRSKRV